MGKKTKSANNLGRSLIKDRFSPAQRSKRGQSLLHTSELNDGYDWGRLNLASVTEESSFQEFLSTATLAGTEFQAEKLNIKFVNPNVGMGLLSEEEKKKIRETQEENKDLIGIPRRPKWDENTSAEELQTAEREQFLEWRRKLAILQETKGLLLTPYEKNLEFWRQLWRVVERSDVVVQIVDARNPLLFRCLDLENYVAEHNIDKNHPQKLNMLLLNKADLLNQEQRQQWAQYFKKEGIKVAFFSAKSAAENILEEEVDDETRIGNIKQIGGNIAEDTEQKNTNTVSKEHVNIKNVQSSEDVDDENNDSIDYEADSDYYESANSDDYESAVDSDNLDDGSTVPGISKEAVSEKKNDAICSSSNENELGKLLTRDELIAFFSHIHSGSTVSEGVTTIGLVGYPNVGKSSTINALIGTKKVSVSATPGKTKHFQTLFLNSHLMLCDCPGLVMPRFVLTKADMICNGVLPVDQMRDHEPPVSLVVSVIPRRVLEKTYGIMLPRPAEGEDPNRSPTARELLDAHGFCRGFMTQNGQPDNPRSARYIVKDFVTGKLLYCHAPPGIPQEQYHKFSIPERMARVTPQTPSSNRALKSSKISTEDLDKQFFKKVSIGVHSRGPTKVGPQSTTSVASTAEKPWKNHKEKRNKREKLRRIYAHLDQC